MTTTDITTIKEQVYDVLSQYVISPNIDNLIDTWYRNKVFFLDRFNGPIYECPDPVQVELTEGEKCDLYMDFLSSIGDERIKSFFCSYNMDEFFENRFEKTTKVYIYNPDTREEDPYPVTKGAKALKTFSQIFHSVHFFGIDDETIRYWQDAASMVIQKQKIKGHFCLSVHPLDFLSLSENAENWRSCHSLDGDYRAGNLEYIQDKSTFVIYLKAAKDKKITRFPDWLPWNSKKWRTLMFLTTDRTLLFAGRSYPFSSDQLLNKGKEIFSKLTYYNSTPWTDKCISTFNFTDSFNRGLQYRYYPVGNILRTMYDICDIPTHGRVYEPLGFNDLLYSHHYVPKYCYLSDPNLYDKGSCYTQDEWEAYFLFTDRTTTKTKLDLHPLVKCLHCGEYYIANHESFVCDNCLEEGYGNLASDEREANESENEEEGEI